MASSARHSVFDWTLVRSANMDFHVWHQPRKQRSIDARVRVCVHIHKYKYVLCTLCIIPDINEYCTVRTIDYDRQCGVVSGDL